MKCLILAAMIQCTPVSDQYLETAVTLHLVDWLQTNWISSNRHKGYYEGNPMLDRHPSRSQINKYMGATLAGMILIHELLPGKYKKTFRKLWMINNGDVVHWNNMIGVGVKF